MSLCCDYQPRAVCLLKEEEDDDDDLPIGLLSLTLSNVNNYLIIILLLCSVLIKKKFN